MAEIESTQTQQAAPEQEPTDKKKSFLPSWWVKPVKPEKVKKPFKQEAIEWGLTLLAALLITFLARSFVFEPVRVDGDSMYPTLHHGEFMYVSKLDYGTGFFGVPFTDIGFYFNVGDNPELFDVVVCRYPGRGSTNFVKRIVGLPGDTVEVVGSSLYVNGVRYEEKFLHETMRDSFAAYTVPGKGDVIEIREGAVYLNGVAQAQQSQYLSVILHERMGENSSYTLPETGDVFEIVGQHLYVNGTLRGSWDRILLQAWEGQSHTLTEDHFFLMGDNRNSSNDSTNAVVGAVSRSKIVGKVEAILWHDVPSTLEDANVKN